MAGHGSPPPQDRANDPSRQVGRLEGPDTPGVEGGHPVSEQTPPAVWQQNIGGS